MDNSQNDIINNVGTSCECQFHRLVDTVNLLRSPDGCPWDREQTHASLRSNLLEETYETLEAIDTSDSQALEEELGDLMIQIVFHADIASKEDRFDADSICSKVEHKLRRRHPHVFGPADKMHSVSDVVDRWEQIKREEAGGDRSIVASIPVALPALALASIVQRRAIRAGIDIHDDRSQRSPNFAPRPQHEEKSETEIRAGEFLMAAVRLIEKAGVDPETALRDAAMSIRNRVLQAEELADGTPLAELTPPERERIWNQTGDSELNVNIEPCE